MLFSQPSAWQNPAMGWFTPNKQLTRIHDRTSELLDTVQRQTNELADLRARLVALEAEREARSAAAATEAEAVAVANASMEANTAATAANMLLTWANRRGAAGGRARAHCSIRWTDETFACRRDQEKAQYEAYLSFARAGTARAARAQRDERGRFLPDHISRRD